MNWQFIFALSSVMIGLHSQTVDPEKWNTVERMCGIVERVEEIPIKGTPSLFTEKRQPIKKADVRVYRRENDAPCCGSSMPLAETLTNRSGVFMFKGSAPGSYWVVVVVDGKEYSHPIKYAPSAKDKVEVSCFDFLYEIRKGELQLGRMITVD
jgi:hypothetical protein